MAQLPLTNVISVSVSQAPQGVGEYNVNNLALFTKDLPATATFGTAGYAIYLDPTSVGTDFGTESETFSMANTVFSQQPNILAGGGYLTVIPLYMLTQTLTPSGSPITGAFDLYYGSTSHISVAYNEGASSIQSALQAIVTAATPGVTVTVSGTLSSGQPLVFTFSGGTVTLPLTVSNNTLAVTFTQTETFETLDAAITRTQGLVQYFGVMATYIPGQSELLATAAVIQPLNLIGFFVGDSSADIQVGGKLDLLRSDDFTKSRGLYYGTGVTVDALTFQAAYAGRALSVNFEGSNTTATMHLKGLVGISADGSLTQTLLNDAVAAGADTYPSLQGVAKVFCSGKNQYFDQVYNLGWFVGALQVAGFNYLAESSTKIPQTEPGMTGLKGAYRAVCEQAVTNNYVAPGQWNSSTTFGNQTDMLNNIANTGYYIYSQPVSQQSQTARAARQAPLIQIAVKEAGAIQSSNLIVYVNP